MCSFSDDLETFVCFWSPEQGCHAVAKKAIVNPNLRNFVTCKICMNYCECPDPLISSAICLEIVTIVTLGIFLLCHILF